MPDPATRAFRLADLPALQAIADGALAAGELVGFTRHDLAGHFERMPLRPEATWVATDARGDAVGLYSPEYPLLIVHPRQRRQGRGRRLVAAELARARERGAARIELAPPRANPGALAFCAALGFAYSSSLWQLVLDPAASVPPPNFPPAIATRPLRPGVDDEPFMALFNAAFAEHPSPMQVTLEMVRHAHTRSSFDPELLLVLTPAERPAELLGFARLSIVYEDDGASHGHIDLLGVLPEWRGRGLGRELLRWGVQTLRSRGVDLLDLAVEARNERALALYERAGFTRAQEWPRWARNVAAH